MSLGVITDRTKAQVSLAALFGAALWLVTNTWRVSTYADTLVIGVKTEMRQERAQELRHYVTREEWVAWQRDESAKRDRQYYSILSAVQRLSDRRR